MWRRRATRIAAGVAAGAMFLSGCTGVSAPLPIATDEGIETSMPAQPPPIADPGLIRPGDGDFTFDGPGELGRHPVHVWYNAPPTGLATSRILIVMTGTQRDGAEYRADWVPLVKDRNTIVLVPEFSEDEYPGVASYNLGRLVDDKGRLLPQREWSFNMIEALFARVAAAVHSNATGYELFGHSAGAQFVHRFIEFMPKTKATIAVAANAGWYTVPDQGIRFPYGLKGAPVDPAGVKSALARKLVVLLGADDIDPHDSSLQRDRHTDEQGKNRLERGLNFYLAAREFAGESAPFNWRLIVVPGIAHSHRDMARAALPLLIAPGPDSSVPQR